MWPMAMEPGRVVRLHASSNRNSEGLALTTGSEFVDRNAKGGGWMRTVLSILVALAMSHWTGMAAEQKGQSTDVIRESSVVRIVDFDKSVAVQIIPDSDVSNLQKRITIETKLIGKALKEATTEWDSVPDRKMVPLPIKVTPRAMKLFSAHLSRKAAEAMKKDEEKAIKAAQGTPHEMTRAEKVKFNFRKAEQADAMAIFKAKLDAAVLAQEDAEEGKAQAKGSP